MKSRMVQIACLGIALVASAAYAQSERIVANVPFDFYAGSTLMSHGTYAIGGATALPVASIRCQDCQDKLALLTNPVAARKIEPAKLVFHRYGDQYFLAQIWQGGEVGRSVPASTRERELRADGARPMMAVIVALRH